MAAVHWQGSHAMGDCCKLTSDDIYIGMAAVLWETAVNLPFLINTLAWQPCYGRLQLTYPL